MDAATKAGLLDLIDDALDAGWTIRRACRALEVGEVRTHRWYARRARGRLADRSPGGSAVHGVLPDATLALAQWTKLLSLRRSAVAPLLGLLLPGAEPPNALRYC